MMDFKVEWVYPYFLKDKPEQHLNELDIMRVKDVPVVRLAEVEKPITHIEEARGIIEEHVPGYTVWLEQTDQLLASVAAWQTGQEPEAKPDKFKGMSICGHFNCDGDHV